MNIDHRKEKKLYLFLFIPPNSFHQPSIFKGWISEYLCRLRILCSNDLSFNFMIDQFHQHLLARGYESNSINEYFSTIPSRESLIIKKKVSYLNWVNNNAFENVNTSQPVRFHLTYDKDSASQLHSIKAALQTSYITCGDPSARLILGSNLHVQLSISNVTSCQHSTSKKESPFVEQNVDVL